MEFGLLCFATPDTVPPGALARLVEERGHGSLWFTEHTHIPAARSSPYPGGGDLPTKYARTYDLFVAMTAAAMATTSLRVGSGICLLIQHDPIVAAKAVASVDLLSGGRVDFGVGLGWNREEMTNHGTDPRRRQDVLRERVEAMKAIWTTEEASYSGEFVNFDRIWSEPKPAQRPHPPVLIGGNGPTVEDRVRGYGDGWMPNHGRDVTERGVRLRASTDRPLQLVAFGVPADPAVFAGYAAAGFDRVIGNLPSAGRGPVERALDGFEQAIAQFRGE